MIRDPLALWCHAKTKRHNLIIGAPILIIDLRANYEALTAVSHKKEKKHRKFVDAALNFHVNKIFEVKQHNLI